MKTSTASYKITIYPALLILVLGWLIAGCSGGSAGQPVIPDQNPDPANSNNQVSEPGANDADPQEGNPDPGSADLNDNQFYIPDPEQPTGTMNFNVAWPVDHSAQIIPENTNRIVIFITGDGIVPAIGVILNNTGETSINVSVPVPSGTNRLVSAVAKSVDALPPDAPSVDFQPKYKDLLEGVMLASGSTDAFDLDIEEIESVTITLEEPAQGNEDNPIIVRKGTQFDLGDFPTIVVYGSVVDEHGNPVTNLTMANFRVYERTEEWEEPRECIVTDVRYVDDSGGLRAGSIVLCLDKSGSLYPNGIGDLKTAAHMFVNMMYPDDQAEVINFSSWVLVSQEFTTDKDLLHNAIDFDMKNMTALYDATYQSITDASGQDGRKAVLIMTDGMENHSSHHGLSDIAQLALTANVPCYAIGLGSVDTNRLNALADATGGVAYFTPDSQELVEIYTQIGIDLATQIRITFISSNPIDYDPDKLRFVSVYLTNYPPITDNGDVLAFETQYYY